MKGVRGLRTVAVLAVAALSGITAAHSGTSETTCLDKDMKATVWVNERPNCAAPLSRQEVSLGKDITLKLNRPLQEIIKEQTPEHKFGLVINDSYMKDLEPLAVPGYPSVAKFQLRRTDNNRDTWTQFFSKKSLVNTGRSSTCTQDKNDRIDITAGYADGSVESPTTTVCLEYFPDPVLTYLLLGLAALIAAGTIVLAVTSPMLRDSGDPRPDRKKGSYSLARFQMALWFVTVVAGFLFVYAVSGEMTDIPQGVLILMGIGAGTAVSAAAIDLSKRTATKQDLREWRESETTLTQKVTLLEAEITERKAANANDASLPRLTQELAAAVKQLADVQARIAGLAKTQVPASKNFIRDVLSDENGIAFHRLQVFGWTMVFWLIFVVSIIHKVTLVDFLTSQLALMGISGATYLGFKLQEPKKDSADSAPAAAK